MVPWCHSGAIKLLIKVPPFPRLFIIWGRRVGRSPLIRRLLSSAEGPEACQTGPVIRGHISYVSNLKSCIVHSAAGLRE